LLKKSNDTRPIGIFDSGIGGLTVANAIHRTLPNEELIYFGDTIHLPYGDKSADAIRYYSLGISKYLLEKNCKLIVVACNSASTTAKEVMEDFFRDKVDFVNVVDPLVDHVINAGHKKVGIIATKATIDSNVYQNLLLERDPYIDVRALATPLLVPMIEEGFVDNEISKATIANYLHSPIFKDLDVLLLACTHYPLIKMSLERVLRDTLILDSTQVVADALKHILTKKNMLCEKRKFHNTFIVSDYTPTFEESAKMFFGDEIKLETDNFWK